MNIIKVRTNSSKVLLKNGHSYLSLTCERPGRGAERPAQAVCASERGVPGGRNSVTLYLEFQGENDHQKKMLMLKS